MTDRFVSENFVGHQREVPIGLLHRTALDARRPMLLSDHEHVLQVATGHVDLFAVQPTGTRQHLFRVDTGESILDLHNACETSGSRLQIIAVGPPGTALFEVPRSAASFGPVSGWIAQLATLMVRSAANEAISELVSVEAIELHPGERRRSPIRNLLWAHLETGTVKLMNLGSSFAPGQPPFPLTGGVWVEAGEHGCKLRLDPNPPDALVLWSAIDRFQIAVVAHLERSLAEGTVRERERLVRRGELIVSQTLDSFERLSDVVVRKADRAQSEFDPADPLLCSCRVVGQELGVPITLSQRAQPARQAFSEILEIARTAQLRIRRVLLRDVWWKTDAGPLLGWHGDERSPVALVRNRANTYTMFDPKDGRHRSVDRSVAGELKPEAITFYPVLPSRPLQYRDLLAFAMRGVSGSVARIGLAVIAIGLLSLIPPLLTNVLVNSVIPRTEIDQLVVCALALTVTAVAITSLQMMQGRVTLRLEGLLDYKLQAALIDRLLRLPTSLFREYTSGDLVDRAMGIDATRRIFTGRVLGGFTASFFCLFSIGLMLYYDLRLGSIALLLTMIRAAAILATSAVRLYYETRHFNLQGKASGFVLQLIAGVGKLRVAGATARALARWSQQFAVQRHYFIASQRAANALSTFDTVFPMLATLTIFALASYTNSQILLDLGAFLGFLAAFGQATAAIGSWASSVSESLVAIPHLSRLKPVISTPAEISEERRSPGELSGEIELSGIVFRYAKGGPKVLDDVSLSIATGDYVAIVGPSGSGKSSLFRLLLGFERAEAGTVFYDGKALNTLDISAVRRQLGVVLQDTKLATGSLYENICGGVDLPLEKAWEAARLAALDADIAQMPMGMHTLVAEGVSTLSGGQRQRVLIARALARSPRILLFDEATSALDNQTQSIVGTSLERLSITRIVIAHRLSTVRNADRIVMLLRGKVVQAGSYAELMSEPGPFADFAERQLLEPAHR
ncbi:NHLP bacteriocin export ABC transporter permease/ATPase subunit (plasmid) [Bradyrhizobium sp. CB82]|uniref:NHLP bacteriocin export ABC transporter permease/ATPase subunit n=1 Tax=Bradyrhizobium sp. CB82 TaxID=3039159 RepID=UPI0024B237AE|nr:NHLP bacteriocin export ABC transporter permease/ATPase subunit [Bradyrhizobium sp. CB82]WFU45904.1 NHLP bacteriocin export ABC transporter permease/ATPase subunit [Bradyrhizobium sp. CB82]